MYICLHAIGISRMSFKLIIKIRGYYVHCLFFSVKFQRVCCILSWILSHVIGIRDSLLECDVFWLTSLYLYFHHWIRFVLAFNQFIFSFRALKIVLIYDTYYILFVMDLLLPSIYISWSGRDCSIIHMTETVCRYSLVLRTAPMSSTNSHSLLETCWKISHA